VPLKLCVFGYGVFARSCRYAAGLAPR